MKVLLHVLHDPLDVPIAIGFELPVVARSRTDDIEMLRAERRLDVAAEPVNDVLLVPVGH